MSDFNATALLVFHNSIKEDVCSHIQQAMGVVVGSNPIFHENNFDEIIPYLFSNVKSTTEWHKCFYLGVNFDDNNSVAELALQQKLTHDEFISGYWLDKDNSPSFQSLYNRAEDIIELQDLINLNDQAYSDLRDFSPRDERIMNNVVKFMRQNEFYINPVLDGLTKLLNEHANELETQVNEFIKVNRIY